MSVTLAVAVALLGVSLPSYGFIADSDRFVQFVRGQTYLYGRLDEHGHFNEYSRRERSPNALGYIGSGNIHDGRLLSNSPGPVYELRYRRLIPGTLRDGEFTPDPDGKPMRFADYRYHGDTTQPIWNLPGIVGRFVVDCGDSEA